MRPALARHTTDYVTTFRNTLSPELWAVLLLYTHDGHDLNRIPFVSLICDNPEAYTNLSLPDHDC